MNLNTHSVAHTLCVSILLLTGACVSHDLREVDPPHVVTCTDADDDLSYSEDIVQIIEANCAIPDCHGSDPDLPDWTQHSVLSENGDKVQFRITLPDSDPNKMPRTGEITDAERQALYCWIENGAPNN